MSLPIPRRTYADLYGPTKGDRIRLADTDLIIEIEKDFTHYGEEITFGGSSTSAFSLEPDAAIVVDVTHATDAPGIEIKEIGKHELGSGAVLGRGSTLHPQLFELLHETAEREQIPFTVEATARATGTDADAVHVSRAGVPTALVSIPIRYMHSPVGLVQLDDVHACARLIAAAALRLDADTSFAR